MTARSAPLVRGRDTYDRGSFAHARRLNDGHRDAPGGPPRRGSHALSEGPVAGEGEPRGLASAGGAAPPAWGQREGDRADQSGGGVEAERAGIPREPRGGLSRDGAIGAGRGVLPGGAGPVARLPRGALQPGPGTPGAGEEVRGRRPVPPGAGIAAPV